MLRAGNAPAARLSYGTGEPKAGRRLRPPALQPPGSEPEARRSFLALSRQVDARSLSSDTIEL